MHVALDARLADYSPGGIAQYTLHLARALAGLGGPDRYTLLRAARPRVLAEQVPELGRATMLTPPHHRWEQFALPLELARLRPDLLHSPDLIPPFRRAWRSVITVHDLGFLRFPETLTADSRRYYGQIGRAVRSTDRIIAVSQTTRDDLVALVGADRARIDVVLEAADPTFRPVREPAALEAARRRLGVSRPFLLFVGSFEPRKNLVGLLDTFAEVRRKQDVELVLVGRRGWLDQPIFDHLARMPERDRVRVVEGVRRDELPAVYSAALALVFPSLYEGFGLPALEAMACGCPVVASDRGALPEVVGDAGLTVPLEDRAELVSLVSQVVEDDRWRADLAARGRARAASFSWERAARETLATYRRAAGLAT